MATRDIILLRHAHASVADSEHDDRTRPLSATGVTEAEAAGAWLKAHDAKPDRVLCSPAARARETCDHVLAALGFADARSEERIYEATPASLIRVLDDHVDADTILLVGHNPGLESLVALLTEGASDSGRGMPPAGIAWLSLSPQGGLEPGSAEVRHFWVAVKINSRKPVARRIVCLALMTALLCARAAEPDRNALGDSLDSTRSKAGFSVKLMLLVSVEGQFKKMRGDIERNPFRDEISVDAHIDATSVTMSNHLYDEWVRSPEFFDVDKYPDIEFASEPIPAVRLRNGGSMPGMLTLRGIRKPVTFMLEAASCAQPGVDCAIRASASVRRSEFEMRSRRGTLGDKVQLAFDVFVKTTPITR